MKVEEFENKISEIQEKIGEEATNLILDDIAVLLTDNKKVNEDEENYKNEIAKLTKRNETLQNVNGNLLQQISMGNIEDDEVHKIEKKETKTFDFRSVFDEKRKF